MITRGWLKVEGKAERRISWMLISGVDHRVKRDLRRQSAMPALIAPKFEKWLAPD